MTIEQQFIFGLITVKEITDNPDGTANVIFEISDEFKNNFKKHYGLKRWSQKRFQSFFIEAIDYSCKYYEEELKDEKRKGLK